MLVSELFRFFETRLISKRLLVRNLYSNDRNASNTEVTLVCVLFLALPLAEAIKNVAAVSFIILFVILSVRHKNFGRGSKYDWVILGLMLVSWASPFFSTLEDFTDPIRSSMRWILIATSVLLLGRLNYSRRDLFFIWASLLVGGIFAVIESLWVWFVTGHEYPEFRSVGHVNHSAMYGLITLSVGIAALFQRNKILIILGIAGVLFTLLFSGPAKSFVAAASIVVIILLTPVIYLVGVKERAATNLVVVCFVSLGGAFLCSFLYNDLIIEVIYNFSQGQGLSGRDKILNSALAVWDQNPIFGTGVSSFGTATSQEMVRAAIASKELDYDPDIYWHFDHGHNLWVNTLIERGLVGLVLTATLLLHYITFSFRATFSNQRPCSTDHGAAIGSFFITIGFLVSGFGNTTMINEHGFAGMAFIAVAYAYRRACTTKASCKKVI